MDMDSGEAGINVDVNLDIDCLILFGDLISAKFWNEPQVNSITKIFIAIKLAVRDYTFTYFLVVPVKIMCGLYLKQGFKNSPYNGER